ncbi:MAG: hypothetical protein WBG38_15915, partial [Nodosilinea sp.]
MARFWLQSVTSRKLLRKQTIDLESLQTRLTAGVVVTSLIGVGLLALWMGWRVQQITLDSHRQGTILVADRLQEDVRYYSEMMPAQEALTRVVKYRTTSDLAIWIETLTGERLAESETLTMGSWQTSGVSAALQRAPIPLGTKVLLLQDWRLVVCASSLDLPGLPPSTLYIAADVTAEYEGLQQLIRMLLVTSLLMMSLLSLAFGLYIRRTLSPIRQLNRLASQVTADTLDRPLNLKAAPTEMQEL